MSRPDRNANGNLESLRDRLNVLSALATPAPLVERLEDALDALLDSRSLGLIQLGGLFRLDRETHVRELLISRGRFEHVFREIGHELHDIKCLWCRAVTDGKPLTSDECPAGACRAPGHCVVPLISENDVYGVMILFTDPKIPWSDDRIEILRDTGRVLGNAIHREETLEIETTKRLLVTLRHEINNSIHGILGTTEALIERDFDSCTRAEQLRCIVEATQRIASFLDNGDTLTRVRRTEYCTGTEMLELDSSGETERDQRSS